MHLLLQALEDMLLMKIGRMTNERRTGKYTRSKLFLSSSQSRLVLYNIIITLLCLVDLPDLGVVVATATGLRLITVGSISSRI